MVVVLSTHEAKAQVEFFTDRLQDARINALGNAIFETFAEERRVPADIRDAQDRRVRQIRRLLGSKAHDLALCTIEEHLRQIRFKTGIDGLRIVDKITEVFDQPLTMLRREEAGGQERCAHQERLAIALLRRTIRDGIDCAVGKRLVQLVGRRVLQDLHRDSFVAQERNDSIVMNPIG